MTEFRFLSLSEISCLYEGIDDYIKDQSDTINTHAKILNFYQFKRSCSKEHENITYDEYYNSSDSSIDDLKETLKNILPPEMF